MLANPFVVIKVIARGWIVASQNNKALKSRATRNSPSKIVSHLLYGYPAELLAEWCLVPLKSAQCWKRGQRQPGRQEIHLFELHRDGRILSRDHWAGWSVRDGTLVDPEGNQPTEPILRDLSAGRELVRDSTGLQKQFQAIVREAG
jgi:hypothetical protein